MLSLFQIIRILLVAGTAFLLAMALEPVLDKFLWRYRLGKQIRVADNSPIFRQLHAKKEGTPTMGGILIWGTVVAVSVLFWGLAEILGGTWRGLNFLSRSQTWLPLGVLIFSAAVGMADDLMGIFKIGPAGGGLRVREKVILYTLVAAIGAWWFYYKLEWDVFHLPFFGDIHIGVLYIPIFIFIVAAAAFSANETDGLDGLAGGILLIAFSALAVVSFQQGRYDLAAFIAAIIGALLAFLWFNIFPAKFFMGDTGSMSLGVVLGVISMYTNTALFLPFFGFILVAESLSVIIQAVSKKFFRQKIFLSTPIHHHFEARGWPESQVTMRFWIISGVMAGLGLILFFLDEFLVQ